MVKFTCPMHVDYQHECMYGEKIHLYLLEEK